MKHKIAYLFILLIVVIISANSCRNKESGWNTNLLAPIATAELSIANLVSDSMLTTNSDNSLNLVYKNTIYGFDFSKSLIDIPDTGISKAFRLDSLKLPQQDFNVRFSLGQLCRQLIASGSAGSVFLGNTIISRNGGFMVYPALTGLTVPATNYDASLYFREIDLISGYMDGWIKNGFPVTIKNVHFQVRNQIGGEVVIDDIIDSIAARDSVFRVYNLSGQHVEGQFTFQLINFDTPGSYGVNAPVDTSDQFELDFRIFGFRASSATAIFPSIDVLASTEDVTQDIQGGAKLTYIEAEEGTLHIYISSSVQEGLTLTYTLEGAYDKMGRPLRVSSFVPPAPSTTTPSRIDRIFDLSGYSIDLTGKDHNTFNTYTQTINARVDSSGIERTITSSDSLTISYSLENIKPRLIKGYAGRDTLTIGPETSNFDFFKNILGGTIGLDDVKLSMSLENGIGVEGDLVIEQFTAKRNTSSVALTAPSVMNTRIRVNKANEFPFRTTQTNIALNKSNSNITRLFELLPDRLEYAMKVYVNPNGNDGTYQDFVNANSKLNVNLNMELPLSLVANNLTLKDTLDFNIGNSLADLESIKGGAINLIADNGYPLEANLDIIVYDEFGGVVDTLLKNYTISAAGLNSSCRVDASKKSYDKIVVSEERMDNLKRAYKAVVIAKFSTKSDQTACNSYLKIYSDYKLKLSLTADFRYNINAKF
ncbi:MAG: hypothetical protein WCP57_05375 [Bacteroidota bacterium]